MEFVMEHIHVYSGTPWWATIALTAVAVRCVFFKAFVNAAENNTRMRALMPITKPLTEKMTAAAKARDQSAVMEYRSEIQLINKRAGVGLLRGFIPMLQFYPAMGTFFLLREMSKIPVPGLETGGILWFKDLTVQDPYFLLPILSATLLHLVLRVRPHYRSLVNWLTRSLTIERWRGGTNSNQPSCSKGYDVRSSYAIAGIHLVVPGWCSIFIRHRFPIILSTSFCLSASLVSVVFQDDTSRTTDYAAESFSI
jgi:hypothetical protein